MFDQEIIQDFLTESGELLERLDQDLVVLETSPRDPELLSAVFRALHTIKGSASFLNLTNLVSVAHAAESALNAARNGQIVLNKPSMDLILGAVDTLKKQFENLKAGQDLVKADDALVAGLLNVAEGRMPVAPSSSVPEGVYLDGTVLNPTDATAGTDTESSAEVPTDDAPTTPAPQTQPKVEKLPLRLPENKQSLIEFLVADVRDTLAQAEAAAAQLGDLTNRNAAASKLTELGESMARAADFFEFEQMGGLSNALANVGSAAPTLGEDILAQALPRVQAILELLREQTDGLAYGTLIKRPIAGLCTTLDALVTTGELPQQQTLASGATPVAALVADGVVIDDVNPADAAPPAPIEFVEDLSTTPIQMPASDAPTALATIAAPAAQPSTTDHTAAKPAANTTAATAEQTIRVEVGRLESLLNLVGELVLQKNRLAAIARGAAHQAALSHDFVESFSTATGNLDRVTSDLQVAVMKTRMQPLDKLFGRYPRLIRDLARKTGKEINLIIEGGDTEVDKSVIEELGDPLVHIMRNSADHGLETPDQRRAANKPEQGAITLRACHEGSSVKVQIIDDGRGLSRDKIGRKALERGLVTAEQLEAMTDADVRSLIFAPGFSTAEQVTDLSGRGVGMDVVRTNIDKLKGAISLESVEGQGTTISIRIPLTVAILTAMMVGIGSETYAVPLASIVEIVRPDAEQLFSVHGSPVMRLRDGVLPLLDGAEVFSLPESQRTETPFVVVIAHGDTRVGLQVTRLIGQQEVVIKPLDEFAEGDGPISGATVRDDGGVSLIVDVARMVATALSRSSRVSTRINTSANRAA